MGVQVLSPPRALCCQQCPRASRAIPVSDTRMGTAWHLYLAPSILQPSPVAPAGQL